MYRFLSCCIYNINFCNTVTVHLKFYKLIVCLPKQYIKLLLQQIYFMLDFKSKIFIMPLTLHKALSKMHEQNSEQK